jgi:ATP-dependent DNA helicase DinG
MIMPVADDVHSPDNPPRVSAGIQPATTTFFSSETPLQRPGALSERDYEHRPQQQLMAEAVAKAFTDGEHLCVEAPTGVGKTFAYLVPAIHAALAWDEQVVVSTHTISLQEQLVERDLPTLKRLMDLDFSFCIAKGRANYLCRRRLENALKSPHIYLDDADDLPGLEELDDWAETATDGSISSLPAEPRRQVWNAVCCEYGNCMGKNCRHVGTCFLFKARQRLESADIIVANHALFFSDLAMKTNPVLDEAGILPEYAAVVLDEAHNIEDSASSHLGLRISSYSVRRVLHRLYNPDSNRGLLTDVPYTEARMATLALIDRSNAFFNRIRNWMAKQDDSLVRYDHPGAINNILNDDFSVLEKHVKDIIDTVEDDETKQEFSGIAEMLFEQKMALSAFLDMEIEDHVYWIETSGSQNIGVTLNSAPVHVGDILKKLMFDSDATVVMTSATLAVDGSLAYFKNRVGAVDARDLILDSPFDFKNQVTLYLAENMPDPKNTGEYAPAVADQVKYFLQKTGGKAFVLFTSYRFMDEVKALTKEFFEDNGLQLLVQGEGMSRTRMLDVFRQEINSVIFGTSSFWTGVDVPGEALSNVIITRLPFAAPNHPLIAARQEAIEAEGKNSFWNYSLPEAVLRFRQGFGRLVRSHSDHGIVVVLDRRIRKTRYGRMFLHSLPECETVTI